MDLILRSGRSPGEGNGKTLQYSCLEIPWTEEPGGLQPVGSQKSQTRLRDQTTLRESEVKRRLKITYSFPLSCIRIKIICLIVAEDTFDSYDTDVGQIGVLPCLWILEASLIFTYFLTGNSFKFIIQTYFEFSTTTTIIIVIHSKWLGIVEIIHSHTATKNKISNKAVWSY